MEKALGRAPAAFGACLAAAALLLLRVAFVESHPDEEASLVTGWLLARGWTLYRDLFSHHLPGDYLPPAALALLGGPSVAAARAAMLAAWAASCGALFTLSRRRTGGAALACAYTVLSACWLTYWHGQLMLIEVWIGHACVLALAILGTPLGEAPAEGRGAAAACGALLGVLLLASPTFLPAALLLAAWAAADPAWRGRRRGLAAGAAAAGAAWLAWALAVSDLSLAFDHVVRFNGSVYSRFLGLDPERPLLSLAAAALRENARAFASAWAWTSLDRFFEGFVRLAALAWCAGLFARGRRAAAVWWAALWVWLAPRFELAPLALPFHRAPFFYVATLVVARQIVLVAPWLSRRGVPGRSGLLLGGAILSFTLIPTAIAANALRAYRRPDAAMDAVAAAVRACLPQDARVAALPMAPALHLATLREPALPAVFYLPWQAAWPPAKRAMLEAWDRSPPAVVLLGGTTSVSGAGWADYAAELDARIKAGFVPVLSWPGEEAGRFQLWARRDLAEGFVRCARRLP